MIEISDNNFKEIVSQDKLVILDFWANWCVPCKLMIPILEDLAKRYPNIIIGKVNIETSQNIAIKFNIRSIPCLVFIKNEQVKDRLIGQNSSKTVENMIIQHI